MWLSVASGAPCSCSSGLGKQFAAKKSSEESVYVNVLDLLLCVAVSFHGTHSAVGNL